MKRGLALLRISAAAVLAAVAPTVATAATPVQRAFSDWTVTCDNGLRCVALGGQDDGGRILAIARDAGPDGAIAADLSGADADLLDGRPFRFPGHWAHTQEEEVHVHESTDLEAIQRFIDTIRNGNRLHSKGNAEDSGLSLRGLSAALLFLDEAQGRLGTRGALLRRGQGQESLVPAAPLLPVLTPAPAPMALGESEANSLVAAVRRAQSAALQKEDCSEDLPDGSDQAWALTDSEALVHLGCLLGAYQASGMLFRVPRKQPAKAAPLSLPSVPGEPAMTLLTSAEYDPARAELHHYAKGRGIGDCGETADWVFDGTAFRLAGYSSLDRCTGIHASLWPTRWRSRNATTGSTP